MLRLEFLGPISRYVYVHGSDPYGRIGSGSDRCGTLVKKRLFCPIKINRYSMICFFLPPVSIVYYRNPRTHSNAHTEIGVAVRQDRKKPAIPDIQGAFLTSIILL